MGRKAQIGLENATRNWQTPNAAAEAPNLGSNIKRGPKSLLAQANSLPARMTTQCGGKCLPSAPNSRRQLNPLFVEWLMGWPENWTSLAPTAYTFSETA